MKPAKLTRSPSLAQMPTLTILAEAPIIVVTADTGSDLSEQCAAAGADDVLQKPVSMNALFDAIARVLNARGGGKALL